VSDIHALSGAYAVDALDDDERARFEGHLAECPACRGEVDSLREASALLAETTATAPPAELRDRVLAGIAGVRPLPPTTATVTTLTPRRRRLTAWLAAAAAAAVVAIGAGGVVWPAVHDDGSPRRLEQIEAAGDVQRYSMSIGDGTATIYRSQELRAAAIETDDMPAAPSGHDYVIWLQQGTVMVPAGVMPAGPDNAVVLEGDAATAAAAGITIETAGSIPDHPSDDVVALFAFHA
jgi:anti-sigma factor RsiW